MSPTIAASPVPRNISRNRVSIKGLLLELAVRLVSEIQQPGHNLEETTRLAGFYFGFGVRTTVKTDSVQQSWQLHILSKVNENAFARAWFSHAERNFHD